jgi:membrane-bound lytic murein transglycosylase D
LNSQNSIDFGFNVNPLIQQFINYYQGRGRSTMETGLRRAGRYTAKAREIFRQEGVPEDIVWPRSGGKRVASSCVFVCGCFRFVAIHTGHGARFGLRQTAWIDERNSFEQATHASARYLKFLSNRYNGNWELAIGAYNTGEGNIDRAISRAGTANF